MNAADLLAAVGLVLLVAWLGLFLYRALATPLVALGGAVLEMLSAALATIAGLTRGRLDRR